MSDFIMFAVSTSMAFALALIGISCVRSKPKRARRFLTCLIVAAFSSFNAWALMINAQKIPVNDVKKVWSEYETFCKENHISWSDLTFPEWLTNEAAR